MNCGPIYLDLENRQLQALTVNHRLCYYYGLFPLRIGLDCGRDGGGKERDSREGAGRADNG